MAAIPSSEISTEGAQDKSSRCVLQASPRSPSPPNGLPTRRLTPLSRAVWPPGPVDSNDNIRDRSTSVSACRELRGNPYKGYGRASARIVEALTDNRNDRHQIRTSFQERRNLGAWLGRHGSSDADDMRSAGAADTVSRRRSGRADDVEAGGEGPAIWTPPTRSQVAALSKHRGDAGRSAGLRPHLQPRHRDDARHSDAVASLVPDDVQPCGQLPYSEAILRSSSDADLASSRVFRPPLGPIARGNRRAHRQRQPRRAPSRARPPVTSQPSSMRVLRPPPDCAASMSLRPQIRIDPDLGRRAACADVARPHARLAE